MGEKNNPLFVGLNEFVKRDLALGSVGGPIRSHCADSDTRLFSGIKRGVALKSGDLRHWFGQLLGCTNTGNSGEHSEIIERTGV